MFTCKTCGEQAGFTTGAPTQVVFCSCYTDTLIAQRDRLAAENAELRKQVEDWKTGSTHEARYGDEARRELAAANATLDKLRKVVPRNMRQRGYGLNQLESVHTILYPQPETPNDSHS